MANENALTQAQPAAPAPFKMNVGAMPVGLALYFDEDVFRRATTAAEVIAKAQGITPEHLLNKPAACFAVITMALTWNLAPQFVAAATYMTPAGKIGYEGKLIQAILEASNRFVGQIKPEFIGDWDRIRGKWKMGKSANGKDIPVRDWTDKDEEGLGVRIVGQLKGEVEPRDFTMWLRECFPRNSTLWPIRPSQQIIYTAMRAFANVACPGVLMGVPFAGDDDGEQSVFMRDITPKAEPAREDFKRAAEPAPAVMAATAAGADTVTGELPAEPASDFGVPDAYEMGVDAKMTGKSMFPPAHLAAHWSDAMVDAYKQGYRDTETKLNSTAMPEKGGS